MGEMSFYASEFDRKLDRCKCWADIICSECKAESKKKQKIAMALLNNVMAK